jgi:hypothetical protein
MLMNFNSIDRNIEIVSLDIMTGVRTPVNMRVLMAYHFVYVFKKKCQNCGVERNN